MPRNSCGKERHPAPTAVPGGSCSELCRAPGTSHRGTPGCQYQAMQVPLPGPAGYVCPTVTSPTHTVCDQPCLKSLFLGVHGTLGLLMPKRSWLQSPRTNSSSSHTDGMPAISFGDSTDRRLFIFFPPPFRLTTGPQHQLLAAQHQPFSKQQVQVVQPRAPLQ